MTLLTHVTQLENIPLHPEDALLNSSFIFLMDLSVDPPKFFSEDRIKKDLQAISNRCHDPLKKYLKKKEGVLEKLDGDSFFLEAANLYAYYIDHCAQSDSFPRLSIKEVEGKGYGLVADEDLVRGVYLGTYTGEIVSKKSCEHEELCGFLTEAHKYLSTPLNIFFKSLTTVAGTIMQARMYRLEISQIESDFVIDALKKGSHIRYVNDADSECAVNIQHELYFNKKQLPHRAYIASRAVKKGEELLVNYGALHLRHCQPKHLREDLKELLGHIDSSQDTIVQKVTGILDCCKYLFPNLGNPFPKQDILEYLQALPKTVDAHTSL